MKLLGSKPCYRQKMESKKNMHAHEILMVFNPMQVYRHSGYISDPMRKIDPFPTALSLGVVFFLYARITLSMNRSSIEIHLLSTYKNHQNETTNNLIQQLIKERRFQDNETTQNCLSGQAANHRLHATRQLLCH